MLNFLANLAIFSNELHHFESEQIITSKYVSVQPPPKLFQFLFPDRLS